MDFLFLLSLYQRQSNQLRIPFRFTHHDILSTFLNLMLGWNSRIKIYCSSSSSEGNEHIFLRNTQLPILIKRFIRNWHSRHSYFICINEGVIHDCTKSEYFIENNGSSSSIFIIVSRQSSGNLHILHLVVTFTKGRQATAFPSQLLQPSFRPSILGISSSIQL